MQIRLRFLAIRVASVSERQQLIKKLNPVRPDPTKCSHPNSLSAMTEYECTKNNKESSLINVTIQVILDQEFKDILNDVQLILCD